MPIAEFRAQLEALPANTPGFGREVEITGTIGAFTGRMDCVLVLWDRGTPRLRIVESKASRKDRTYHRVQLSVYVILLRDLLRANPLVIAGPPPIPPAARR